VASLDSTEGEDLGTGAIPAPARLLNPHERAVAARSFFRVDAPAKVKAARVALKNSASKAAEANRAMIAQRGAELAVAAAQRKVDAAARAATAATSEYAEEAQHILAAAGNTLENASRAAKATAAVSATSMPEALAAARAAWEAEAASKASVAARQEAERAVEPLSIFVSAKLGRVFIRQNLVPVHEAPATFRSGDSPLGTYAFLALGATDDGKGLRWLSITLPPSSSRLSRHAKPIDVDPAASPSGLSETAAGVLDRLELADETKGFIAERLWRGGSLIISEHGISTETGPQTDFIVLTR
jgi:hypothetical protein